MPIGPGKYDDEAMSVRKETEAEGVMLLVLRGNLGSGFSVQWPTDLLHVLPGILREAAKKCEDDIKGN